LKAVVGRPISISEEPIYVPRYYLGTPMTQNSMSEAPPIDRGDSGTLAPGQISVSARVSVVFELQ
jgi:uncharacterized protein YggE